MAITCAPKCRVLIVDDDKDTVESTALLFEIEGHATRTAVNGVDALARGAEFHPDLMLLDIGMPAMDGFAVAAAMRATDWGKQAILAAVTGYGTPAKRQQAVECGFDQYFLKPVNYGIVADILSETSPSVFELKREVATLKQKYAMGLATFARMKQENAGVLTQFVRLEVELARRFLDASALLRDPLVSERNRANALIACAEVEKWMNKETGMTPEDQRDIAAELARLKLRLEIR